MKSLTSDLTTICLFISITACSQSSHVYTSGGMGAKKVKANKNYVTKDIRRGDFKKIGVAGSANVIYKQKSGAPKVEVYTSENIVDLLDIRVNDNTLLIGFKKGYSISYDKLEVRVSSADLNGVSVAGSGDFDFANGLKTSSDLSISVAGSGDVSGKNLACSNLKVSVAGSGDVNNENITCSNLKVSVAGSGDMKLKNVTATNTEASIAGSGTVQLNGTTQEASYSVSGSGDLFASEFQAKRASASVSGSGNVKCYATEFLKVRTSGSGSVGYKGNPELDYPKKGLYKL